MHCLNPNNYDDTPAGRAAFNDAIEAERKRYNQAQAEKKEAARLAAIEGGML